MPLPLPRLPAALIAAGVVSGGSGLLLVGAGARNMFAARQQSAATQQRYQERRTLTQRRLAGTNDRLAELGRLQEQCLVDVVTRMAQFLRRHRKQVRDSARLLVDAVDAPVHSMPDLATFVTDPTPWIAGAVSSVVAGAGTGAGITAAADRWGVASTGTPISRLAGAAAERARLAMFGGGSIASGGGGIALGALALRAVKIGPAVLVSGLVTKAEGTKALTGAREDEASVAVACAELDTTDTHLDAVDRRAAEISALLTKLREPAIAALQELESVTFDADEHAALFQKAMTLVVAVRDVATTPLVTSDGSLDDRSGALTVRYRPMIAEVDNG